MNLILSTLFTILCSPGFLLSNEQQVVLKGEGELPHYFEIELKKDEMYLYTNKTDSLYFIIDSDTIKPVKTNHPNILFREIKF